MEDFFMSTYSCEEYLYWNKFQASVSYFLIEVCGIQGFHNI